MIISRSPLRITLGGGGTDLPSYYLKNEGFLISAAINKYVYVTVLRPFKKGIYLKYSLLENVQRVKEVKHPIIREVLKLQNYRPPQIEITTLTDIPAGTGLGSSGSFTTALLRGIYQHNNKKIKSKTLAELACHIEIDRLGEPIGKQDQYISTYGGLTCFTFKRNNKVLVQPLKLQNSTIEDLNKNLLLFFTGFSRNSGKILKEQYLKSKNNDKKMLDNLDFIKELGFKSREALLSGNTIKFAKLMNEHWEYKKFRSKDMTNTKIDKWYNAGLKNGAIGGKIVGAGGGGFLMFYAKNKKKLRYQMLKEGLEEVLFNFDFEGTKIIVK